LTARTAKELVPRGERVLLGEMIGSGSHSENASAATDQRRDGVPDP
jgi:hypothetical protein